VDRLRLLKAWRQADHGHDNEILSIIKEQSQSDYKLTSFYKRCSVNIAMPINKFRLSLGGGGSESHYQWRDCSEIMCVITLFIVAADFEKKSRKIR